MEYNSQKDALIMPEYGRNVQLLIQYAKTIEDNEYRQAFAEKIIGLMHQMNPQNKSIDDYQHKLWKHLFYIADYKLDVSAPNGEIFTRENARKVPKRIDYPNARARFRHYGENVQKMLEKAQEMEPGSKREGFVAVIGSYMKLAYRTWNKEHYVSDEIIKNDLTTLSDGNISLADDVQIENLAPPPTRRRSGGNNNSNNNNRRHNNNYNGGGKDYKNRKKNTRRK